jgi:hypothetical protein
MGIREPAANWDGVVGVEDIRSRGVVNDDGVLEVTAQLGEIL